MRPSDKAWNRPLRYRISSFIWYPPSMVTYRLANAGDTADIVSLLIEIMQHHGVAIPEESRLDSVVRSALSSPYHSFLLAEDAGAAVGMCALVFTYSTWSAALACELQDVVVPGGRRRANIGR